MLLLHLLTFVNIKKRICFVRLFELVTQTFPRDLSSVRMTV